jgi:hypothetical protein
MCQSVYWWTAAGHQKDLAHMHAEFWSKQCLLLIDMQQHDLTLVPCFLFI